MAKPKTKGLGETQVETTETAAAPATVATIPPDSAAPATKAAPEPEPQETLEDQIEALEAEIKAFKDPYAALKPLIEKRAALFKEKHDFEHAFPKREAEIDTAISRARAAGAPEHDRQAAVQNKLRELKAEVVKRDEEERNFRLLNPTLPDDSEWLKKNNPPAAE